MYVLPVRAPQDLVLHGSDYVPCFGSTNHWLIDEIARTPPAARDTSRVRKYHGDFLQLADRFEAHLKETGRPFLGARGFSAADIAFGCELNRHVLCSIKGRREGLLELPASRFPHLLGPEPNVWSPPGVSRSAVMASLDARTVGDGSYFGRLLQRGPFRTAVWFHEALHTGLASEARMRQALCRGLPLLDIAEIMIHDIDT